MSLIISNILTLIRGTNRGVTRNVKLRETKHVDRWNPEYEKQRIRAKPEFSSSRSNSRFRVVATRVLLIQSSGNRRRFNEIP